MTEPDPLNDEAFRVVVTQSMAEISGRTLSPLTDAGGLVVGGVLANMLDTFTVEMHPTLPLPLLPPLAQMLPVPLPPPTLPPIPAPCTPSPQHLSLGARPTTSSHSIFEKADCHWRK